MAHLVVEASQHLLATVKLRDLRAEATKDRRKLAGDVSPADDHEALRKLGQVEDLVRRDRELAARHFRHDWPATGGHQHMGRTVGLAIDLDHVRAGQSRAPTQQLHARVGQQLRVDGVQARDLTGAVGLQQRPVERRRLRLPAEAMRFLEGFGVVRGVAVELLRDATEVDAGAAQGRVFGDRDARATLRRHARGTHAAAAGADDEEIEVR